MLHIGSYVRGKLFGSRIQRKLQLTRSNYFRSNHSVCTDATRKVIHGDCFHFPPHRIFRRRQEQQAAVERCQKFRSVRIMRRECRESTRIVSTDHHIMGASSIDR